MSLDVTLKLLGLFSVIVVGWGAARMGAFGTPDASRALSSAAFFLFGPALLFRTTAVMSFDPGSNRMMVIFFGTVMAWMAGVRWWVRRRPAPGQLPAAPAVRAVTVGFGNSVQLGIPMAAVVFGEVGLQMHLTVVSLHALILLSACTIWAEVDVAHAQARQAGGRVAMGRLLFKTARNTVIHPVVLPVLLGLGWNVLGWPLPSLVDGTLQLLGQAMVPLCLVLIGVSLQEYGLSGNLRGAVRLSILKLLVLPALVLGVTYGVAGLRGLPLSVAVMAAALPVGSNPLLFANRYGTLEAETTATIVVSTAAYMLTAPLWLMVLGSLSAL